MVSATNRIASLLKQVAREEISGPEALRLVESELFSDIDWHIKPFAQAYHLLQHFAADEDIREKDPGYARRQRRSLEKIAVELSDDNE